jgi:hypothetical protein
VESWKKAEKELRYEINIKRNGKKKKKLMMKFIARSKAIEQIGGGNFKGGILMKHEKLFLWTLKCFISSCY